MIVLFLTAQVEEELQMYEALDQFELEQEATLYAEDYPPPPPRQRQQRNPRNQGYHGGNGMNNRPFYSNGVSKHCLIFDLTNCNVFNFVP